jgi:predicted RND superfamily exporter protein
MTRLEALLRWMTRSPWLAFGLAMAITALFGWSASNLSIRTNIEDLFPEHTPRVVRAKAARAKLARSSQILMVIASPDREANERFATDLARELALDELVDTVDLKHDVSFFKRNALLFLSPAELSPIEERLRQAIRTAVAKDLGPYDDEGGPEVADDSDDLDEDFGEGMDEEFGDQPAAAEPGPEPAGDSGFALPDEDEIREKYGITSLSEYLCNRDGTLYGVKVYPTFSSSKVGRSKELLARIEATVARLDPASYHPEMEWTMEGDYHKKIEEIEIIQSDLSRASLFALGLILVLVALYFGSFRAILFVFVPLLSGLAWTMGLAWLTVGYLNLITAFIFAIMFGLGVDFAVHAVNRYLEGREGGKSVEDALVSGLTHLGRPMIAAAITTTVTFLSLVIFDFRGFSQFGLIAGLGVPICLLVVYLVFPPLTVILHRIWPEKPPRSKRFSGVATSRLFGSRKRAIAVLAVCLGVVMLLAPGASRVDFEKDMKKVMTKQKETDRSRLMTRFRREVEGLSTSPVILLTESQEETLKIHTFLARHKGDYTYLQDFASIYSFVPQDQEVRLAIIDSMRERLGKKIGALKGDDLAQAQKAMEYLSPSLFGINDLPDWVLSQFTDKDGNIGHFVTLYAHGHKAHAVDVGRILDELDPLTIDGKAYPTTASYYILRDAYDIVLEEGPVAVLLAALAVLLLLFVDFRTLREVMAAFLPLLFGVVAYLGYMGWTGQDINMFNMVILPTVFGIGIDSSIHLVHRVREEGVGKMGLIANTTGSAAGMSAATTAIGFGSLALATNPGLRSIGVLAPVGIILCYLASVLLTCSLSTLWQGKSKGDSK